MENQEPNFIEVNKRAEFDYIRRARIAEKLELTRLAAVAGQSASVILFYVNDILFIQSAMNNPQEAIPKEEVSVIALSFVTVVSCTAIDIALAKIIRNDLKVRSLNLNERVKLAFRKGKTFVEDKIDIVNEHRRRF